jgi:spermidine/putrescine transport system permease protein
VGRGEGGVSARSYGTWPAASRRRARRRRLDLATPSLLGLPVAWLIVFFLAPIAIVAAYSVDALSLFPGAHEVTLAGWRGFVHGGVYLRLFWKSVQMSLIVSALVVLVAYPLAYYLALGGTRRKYVLLLVLIAPFLTSYLLRVLAWKVILGDQGVVNTFLFWTGLRSPGHPLSQLLYSRFAVMLVLGYVWLPFVALPIFVSLESLDRRLLEAASDLGASRLQAFRRITLPLSLPGVVAAFLFVFIPTVGEFITPSLVGGTSGYMYGNQIVDLFGTGFPDWETGSVLALFLLAVVAALTGVFARFLQQRQPVSA